MNQNLSRFLFAAVETALCLLAAVFLFALSGHGFLGLLCLAIAALLAFFRFTRLPARKSRKARTARLVVSVLLIVGLLTASVPGFFIWRASSGDDADCKYIVVLGAGVNGTVPSLSLKERIDAAADYLAAHPEAVAVLSGGQGPHEEITEAACMYRELLARGVAPERLWLEDCAENTRENISLSLAVIQENSGARPAEIGVVSADYHLCRAELYAKEQGVAAYGIPAKSTWPTLWLNYFLREIAALMAYWVFSL